MDTISNISSQTQYLTPFFILDFQEHVFRPVREIHLFASAPAPKRCVLKTVQTVRSLVEWCPQESTVFRSSCSGINVFVFRWVLTEQVFVSVPPFYLNGVVFGERFSVTKYRCKHITKHNNQYRYTPPGPGPPFGGVVVCSLSMFIGIWAIVQTCP